MGYPWKNLSPKDGYGVRRMSFLSNVDQKVLTLLYQPLIGRDAYSLYMTWWAETESTGKGIKEGILAEILTIQNMGIPEFFQARSRLEALGLVKTFHKNESEYCVYELHSPLSAERFLVDDMLQLLLLTQVGEQTFKRLKEQLLLPTWNRGNYTETTRAFPDVYRFNWKDSPNTRLNEIDKEVSAEYEIKDEEKDHHPVKVAHTGFDWSFFSTNLSEQFLTQKSVSESKETIEMLYLLYGIDELKMARFVLESADAVSGEVDTDKLKKIIHRQYRTPTIQKKEDTTQAESTETAIISGGSKEDAHLLRISEKRNPADFLISIKKQKGGFITQVEQWTLEDIVARSGLSSSVINILIHYILVVKDSAIFERNLAYKIANDWAQSKVKTPQQAMEKVRQLYESNQKRVQESKTGNKWKSKSYSSKNTTARKETLPEWAKDENTKNAPADQPLSQEEQQAFKERLKKIRGYRKEGEK